MQNHRTEQELNDFVEVMDKWTPAILRLAVLAALIATGIYLYLKH